MPATRRASSTSASSGRARQPSSKYDGIVHAFTHQRPRSGARRAGPILRGRATRPEQKPTIAPVVGPDDSRRFTDSGIEIEKLYTERDVADGLPERLGEPGNYPFTRGIHKDMYRGRLWTMR